MTLSRVCLGLLAVPTAVVGVWAAVFPESFYSDFPGVGAAWVGVNGPFNEHLIRDVGQFNLALAVLLVLAALRPAPLLVVAAAITYLVAALPHIVYHVTHLSALTTADAAAETTTLLAGAGLAAAALWDAARARSSSPEPGRDPAPRPARAAGPTQ